MKKKKVKFFIAQIAILFSVLAWPLHRLAAQNCDSVDFRITTRFIFSNYDKYTQGKLEKTPNGAISLVVQFNTICDSVKLPLLWCAFYKNYKTKSIIYHSSKKITLKKILDTLSFPLVLIENLEGQFRAWNGTFDAYQGDTTQGIFYELKDHDCEEQIILHTLKRHSKYVKCSTCETGYQLSGAFQREMLIPFDDLRVKLSDYTCRLHYVFIPTKAEKRKGLKKRVYTSNWYPIYKIKK